MNTTPWFPGCIKPVHIGVYERRGAGCDYVDGYAFWNGAQWAWSAITPKTALLYRSNISRYQSDDSIPFEWRGILKDSES